jgi:DNA repair protein RecN (Recombination protein N)
VELLFTANPGEEPRPLAKTASGGELARFVLGLKAVSAKGERGKTLVFDEVDAGIGGRVADAVGEKLKELARVHQVICVTHLPQIASFAPAHYRIDKIEREGRTETRIARLDPESRVDEIARMLAGAVVTESARQHARQLVQDKS